MCGGGTLPVVALFSHPRGRRVSRAGDGSHAPLVAGTHCVLFNGLGTQHKTCSVDPDRTSYIPRQRPTSVQYK
jgi:hypothetical protein